MKKITTLFIVTLIGLFGSSLASAADAQIQGYSLVSYFDQDKAVKGKAEHAVDHSGKTYHFESAASAKKFKSNPTKYLPQYGGWCAYAMAWGKRVKIDPSAFKIVDGKLYLNKKASIKKLWEKKRAKYIKDADKHWVTVSKK